VRGKVAGETAAAAERMAAAGAVAEAAPVAEAAVVRAVAGVKEAVVAAKRWPRQAGAEAVSVKVAGETAAAAERTAAAGAVAEAAPVAEAAVVRAVAEVLGGAAAEGQSAQGWVATLKAGSVVGVTEAEVAAKRWPRQPWSEATEDEVLPRVEEGRVIGPLGWARACRWSR